MRAQEILGINTVITQICKFYSPGYWVIYSLCSGFMSMATFEHVYMLCERFANINPMLYCNYTYPSNHLKVVLSVEIDEFAIEEPLEGRIQ